MTALPLYLTLHQGSRFERAVVLTGTDLSGVSVKCQLRRMAHLPVVLELTSAAGGVVIDVPTSTLTLVVDETDTAKLEPGGFVYDLLVYGSGGTIDRRVQGRGEVRYNVTR